MNRDLDGYYFRVKTDNGFEDICFSDLTTEQMDEVLEDKDPLWLRQLCKGLAETIKEIGDTFDIERRC